MRITVGSTNPVKINAVKNAFSNAFSDKIIEVSGLNINSGVSDQPMSDKESIKGAYNRAEQSLILGKTDYGVGLEGGIQKIDKFWFDCGWAVIINKKREWGIGSSVRVLLSDKMISLIKEGKELGEVSDILFKRTNSKQAEGHFGIMTNNLITRTSGYRDSIYSALTRFLHPEVF